MVSTLEQMQVPNGTGPGVRRSKRPLLASRTRCNVLWKPQKFGIKSKSVIKSSSVISLFFIFQLLGECDCWWTKESPRAHEAKFYS